MSKLGVTITVISGFDTSMLAIDKLRRSGMTTQQLASELGCTEHTVRNWDRGDKFVSREHFGAINRLAEARGLTLLASDFIASKQEAAHA